MAWAPPLLSSSLFSSLCLSSPPLPPLLLLLFLSSPPPFPLPYFLSSSLLSSTSSTLPSSSPLLLSSPLVLSPPLLFPPPMPSLLWKVPLSFDLALQDLIKTPSSVTFLIMMSVVFFLEQLWASKKKIQHCYIGALVIFSGKTQRKRTLCGAPSDCDPVSWGGWSTSVGLITAGKHTHT